VGADDALIAFSSEVDTGSREENASKQTISLTCVIGAQLQNSPILKKFEGGQS
jgi:hypothetical protein